MMIGKTIFCCCWLSLAIIIIANNFSTSGAEPKAAKPFRLATPSVPDIKIPQGYRYSLWETVVPRRPLARRYDIKDLGYDELYHGWADVQGQGAANDYCRFVGVKPNVFLSCALAGTHGQSEYNYVSARQGFDVGLPNTWYMKDEDGDGRDDYCRCVGVDVEKRMVACSRAGSNGFEGSPEMDDVSYSFTPTGHVDCERRNIRMDFGRATGFLIWDQNKMNKLQYPTE